MKNIIIILSIIAGMAFTAMPVQAQSNRQLRKAERAERKQQEARQREKAHQQILSLIKDKNFVLEAHTVYDRRQNTYSVSPQLNFVALNGNKATIQLGNAGGVGSNGVGGITIDGSVASYEVRDRKGSVSLIAQISSAALGNATLTMNVFGDGMARARVRGSFGSEVTFAGNLADPANSLVYKGAPVF